jgi:hypothetical protein
MVVMAARRGLNTDPLARCDNGANSGAAEVGPDG